MDITCNVCLRDFVYSRQSRSTYSTCRGCIINRHRWTLKWWMIQSRGGACQVCGYKKCPRSLDFHHVDPSKKNLDFTGGHTRSWKRIEAELKKTVLVCRNCHGEIHETMEAESLGRDHSELLGRLKKLAKEPLIQMPKFSRNYWKLMHPRFRRDESLSIHSPGILNILHNLKKESWEEAKNAMARSALARYAK